MKAYVLVGSWCHDDWIVSVSLDKEKAKAALVEAISNDKERLLGYTYEIEEFEVLG